MIQALNKAKELTDIEEKVFGGLRLTREDALRLYATDDLLSLGRMASKVKERKSGEKVYYVINRHINYSNICTLSCMFCAFAKKRGEAGAYEYSIDEMIQKAGEAVAQGATEVHMVGGLHPDYPFEYYEDLLRALRKQFPALHLKAFTAVEIDYFATIANITHQEVIARLREAGLGSMTGGGVEILSDRVWKKIFKDKMGPDQWIKVQRIAHGMGIRGTATMLYGHIETDEECVDHLLRLRELQDEFGGFMAFIPLRFHPENTQLKKIRFTSAWNTVRHLAIARLMLDNFDHIKTYWIMNGVDTAQLSLAFGVDDFDGTVIEEKITHMAGATSPQGLTVMDIRNLIEAAGKKPIQRDSLYNELT